MNLNKVFILGRLTRDPEKRNLPNGNPVVSFGVATNRFYSGQNQEKKEETEFHNIVLFGKLADTAFQYLKKGGLVLIEGRLRTSNWQDSAGIKHYRTEIIGERLQLGPRNFASRNNIYNNIQNNKANNIDKEDIPIIEEEGSKDFNSPENPNDSLDEEIDIRKIPF